ncbi:ligand-binding sensor domain-containing protein [Spiroplasma chrysopicola]|uniref:Uncharacterized protein n=1 Tax=Spiroplasma chrysopicola DF-1 TaxID=1276227 RepID=R4UI85_9MOLU|nr:PQQ-binding-like beta-propeller repeat protein [Spiroplasma chrysopicola]AGM25026.1 hypothetical protein SCHRY_v1c04450 [Spiroplasma chrysopicola DF-1]
MENKVQRFFASMCNSCQYQFKKVISVVKKNVSKDLNDLELFLCHVDKNRSINEDNGVVPVAFIFCKNDSYVFFWKDAFYNGDGSSKIKVVNNTITLSQDTINLIKEGNKDKNQLAVVKKEQTQAIATKLIKENNVSIQHHFNRQMAIINRQNLLHMTKVKKMILSIGLVLILLLATLGGTLGWYFSTKNNVSNQQLPNYNWRINLAEHLKNSQLGGIVDNREETILTVAKDKNPDLKIEDLYLTNITETTATVIVKSSSNVYDYNSSVKVNYLADLKTLVTDVKKVNFPKTVIEGTPEELLDIVQGAYENGDLVRSDVVIGNLQPLGDVLQADLTVIKDSKIYLNNDVLKLYFSDSNRKLLSEVLTNVNIGDVINKDENTILNKIKDLNPAVNIKEIEVVSDSITSEQALIKVKMDSKDYIINDEKIKLYYRVFNPNIGTVKKEVSNWSEIQGGRIQSLIYLNYNDTILVGATHGLYLLYPNGTFNKKIVDDRIPDDFTVHSMLKQKNGNILVGTNNNNVYQLFPDGSFKGEVTNTFDVHSMVESSPGLILAATYDGKIYQLDSQGNNISQEPISEDLGAPKGMIKLSNGTVLLVTNADDGTIYKLYVNGLKDHIIQNTVSSPSSLIELKDGTILLGSYIQNLIYQLNDDGTIKEKVNINDDSVLVCFVQTTPAGDIFAGTYGGSIVQLNNA